MTATAPPGPLELLVLQPTPFCNLDCSYCYLPNRQSTRRMSPDTLGRALEWVFSSDLARAPFTLLWHAGEPLVVPLAFYEEAVALLDRHNRPGVPVQQSFQTNATLLDEEWCDFILRRRVHLGVSVDGPAFLHDRHRRTRQGQGTLGRVLRGIHLLNEKGVPFDALTVLTADSLDCPDELFDFYQAHKISSIAFNVEEIEGPHTTSSLLGPGTEKRFRRFLSRFLDLAYSASPPLAVREYETAATAIRWARLGPGARAQEDKPWAIVNIDCEGNFSTYSPELLGLSSPRHGSFALGNVARDALADVLASGRFCQLEEEIHRGVEMCEGSCPYFAFCGGGPPGNKYFENGTFASTETLSCRLHKKVCIDSWSERLLLGEVEEVDGHFIPRLGWRAPTGEEQLVLVGDPSLLTKDEVLDRGLCLFGLPRHLQSASWALLGRAQEVASPPRLEGFDGFVREVGKFLDFKGLPVPEGAAFDLVLSKPGQRSVRGSWPLPDAAPWPHLWGGINLGDEALSLLFVNLTARQIQAELVRQFPDRPPPTDLDELARRFLAHCPDYPLVRLSSEPGEGYRAPTDGLLIDACTLGMQGPSVMLLVRHPMPVTLEPRTPRRGNG